MMLGKAVFRGGACAVVSGAFASLALADFPPPTDPFVQVSIFSGGKTGTFIAPVSGAIDTPDGKSWSAGAPFDIMADDNSGVVLGTFQGLAVDAAEDVMATAAVVDRQINLNFELQAGASDAVISISSVELSFPTITPGPGSFGAATANLTLTDADAGNPGAILTATGGQFGDRAYMARTNGLVPAGTVFGDLLPSFNIPTSNPGGSDTENGATGLVSLTSPTSSMSAGFEFTLSAGDSASGSSAFILVPEPASLLLLASGALLMVGRRR